MRPDDDQTAYIEYLRRGRTGCDELYLHEASVLRDLAVDELKREAEARKNAPAVIEEKIEPTPIHWRTAMPFVLVALFGLASAGWAFATTYKSVQLDKERAAFEEERDAKITRLENAFGYIVGNAVKARGQGDTQAAINILHLLEDVNTTRALPHSNMHVIDRLRDDLFVSIIESAYGVSLNQDREQNFRRALEEATASPQNGDPYKESLLYLKQLSCGLEHAIMSSVSSHPDALGAVLNQISIECHWLLSEPLFSGPLDNDCRHGASIVQAQSIEQAAHTACEIACKALEDYCDGEISAAQCSLSSFESALDQISELAGLK